ncbi:MAG: hypothetical protein ACO4AI_04505, partial [Prochlorothrix sp.]
MDLPPDLWKMTRFLRKASDLARTGTSKSFKFYQNPHPGMGVMASGPGILVREAKTSDFLMDKCYFSREFLMGTSINWVGRQSRPVAALGFASQSAGRL